jgi:hypothetical protein
MMKRVSTRKEEKKASAPEEVVYTAEIIQEKAASEEEANTAAETKDDVKEKKEERVYLNPLTGWTWPRAPPADPPLRTKDGRVPKVALVVIVNPSFWSRKFDKLFSRLRYLESLFDGCEVDLLWRLYMGAREVPSNFENEWQSELDRWKLFFAGNSLNDVYAYIMPRHYDFALFMVVMGDHADAGVNYGSPEIMEVRRTLRACMLSTGGNAMFGDWGLPMDYPRRITDEMDDVSVASFFDKPYYCDWKNSNKIYAFADGKQPTHSRPFARMIRLGRYIRPVSIDNEALPEKAVERIRAAVRGKAFNRASIWAAWWAAFNGLFFPYDLISRSEYYRWNRLPMIQYIQTGIAKLYEDYCEWYYNSWEEEKMRVMLKIGDSVILLIKVVLLIYVMYLTWQWWMLEGDKGTTETCGGVVKINYEI